MIYGFKSGWELPIYPDHIVKFYANIYTKIFKLLGTLATGIIVGVIDFKLDYYTHYIFIAISLTYIFYRFVLVFYIIKQFIHNVRTGKLLVRNYPLDMFGSLLKSSANVLKACAGLIVRCGFSYVLFYKLGFKYNREAINFEYYLNNLTREVIKLVEQGKFKKFIDSDKIIEFFNNINNLSFEQTVYLTHLSGSLSILLCVISILGITYSNYLIDYFKLETKYPGIAKFIQLRKKFQQYYIMIDVSIILFVCLGMIYINLTLLEII